MIEYLSVKNFALIKEAHVDFKERLNVLTGETGSGKSILLGSINLALGGRASKDVIRDENEETSVTISFDIKDKSLIKFLKEKEILLEDGKLIIYRKITKDKNVVRINDEPCTLAKLREVTEKLIDIYGQHDGDDLRKDIKHIDYLDDFIGVEVADKKDEIYKLYDELKDVEERLLSFDLDEKMRLREIDILKYEIEELENANIKDGEEETLAERVKLALSSKHIVESLNSSINTLESLDISSAIRELKDATKYDESLIKIYEGLIDADSIISDSIKEISKKQDTYDIDEKELSIMSDRLDTIRGILAKYDNSIEVAKKELDSKVKRLKELENYEEEKKKAESSFKLIKEKLYKACKTLSELRKSKKADFVKKIVFELDDLGFNDVKFDIDIKEKDGVTRNGIDDVVFMISLNKGETMKPLSDIASGGELSRIMLSIKTVLSESVGIETLIFDEIDAGISGITASKVAVKLDKIAKNHQVILITHLPQIAAMADTHFIIRKDVEGDRTITHIDELDRNGEIDEIGRLISTSGELTKNVLANAKELKDNAIKSKGE